MRRAQTSTEYIILVAVVIVIAVVVSSILGDFPGIGGGTSKKVEDYKLTTSKVGVIDYANFSTYSLIKIRNNNYDTLIAEAVNVNGDDCNDTENLPATINVGQSIVLNCSVIFEGTPDINIIWSDPSTGSSYATGENATSAEDVPLVSPDYVVTGTTSPDVNGNYFVTGGTFNGVAVFMRDDGAFYLYAGEYYPDMPPTTYWYVISDELIVYDEHSDYPDNSFWCGTIVEDTLPPTGLYGADSTISQATGTAIVSIP